MLNQIINLPKLRFGEFEGEYKEHLFHDIFLFSTGKNIKQKEASPEFEIPCIRYGELYHMYNEVVYKIINRTNLDKSELLFSQGNEILLPSAGEDPLDIGSASALTLKNIAIGRTINILRPKDKNIYSQKYVSYYINEKLKRKISTLAKGSSISNVYNSDLKKLKIILPTLDEQQKIDDFITSIDKKIEQLNQKRTLLESYKKGVMQKIFSQEIRFKRDDGGVFEDWEEKRLFDLLIIQRGASPRPIQSFISYEGVNWIKIGDISEEAKYIEKTKQKITHEGAKKSRKIKPNDFILSNSMSFGRPYISKIHGCIHDGWLLMRNINKKVLSNDFLYELLSSEKIKKQFKSLAAGSTVNNLKSETVRTVKVSLPQLEEQQKISNFLTSIDQKITQNNQVLEEMKAFKKGLLQQMFV